MVVKSKPSKVKSKPTKVKTSFIQKNKKTLAGAALSSILAVATGYKIYSDKKKKERNKVLNEYSQNLKNIIENRDKFLACNKDIVPLGNKSNLDILPFEKLDDILKNFKSMSDINNTCLVNIKIKEYCCNNRQRIFKEIFAYLGYTKGINNSNAEYLFSFLKPKSNYNLIDIFYIKHLSSFFNNIFLIIIIIALNDKLKLSDIDHTKNNEVWGFYPAIYYYTPNTSIKKYILNEYNKLTINNVNNIEFDYFPSCDNMGNYIVTNIIPKLHTLTDSDIYNYSKIFIKSYKENYGYTNVNLLLPN